MHIMCKCTSYSSQTRHKEMCLKLRLFNTEHEPCTTMCKERQYQFLGNTEPGTIMYKECTLRGNRSTIITSFSAPEAVPFFTVVHVETSLEDRVTYPLQRAWNPSSWVILKRACSMPRYLVCALSLSSLCPCTWSLVFVVSMGNVPKNQIAHNNRVTVISWQKRQWLEGLCTSQGPRVKLKSSATLFGAPAAASNLVVGIDTCRRTRKYNTVKG